MATQESSLSGPLPDRWIKLIEGWTMESRSDEKAASLIKALFRRENGEVDEYAKRQSFLHDCVSLGNFETGLLERGSVTSKEKNRKGEAQQQLAEVERLPLLLRILSKGRPFVAVTFPTFRKEEDEDKQQEQEQDKSKCTTTENEGKSETEGPDNAMPDNLDGGKDGLQAPEVTKKKSDLQTKSLKEKKTTKRIVSVENDNQEYMDDVLEQAVLRLEDRAAVYSASEGVEVVSCHLAPYVSRKIAKLPTLRQNKDLSRAWETKELMAIARNPSNARFQHQQQSVPGQQQQQSVEQSQPNKKRRKLIPEVINAAEADNNDSQEIYDSDDYGESQDYALEGEEKGLKNTPTKLPPRKRHSSLSRQDSTVLAEGAAEDSQEAFVTKTLSELALLVGDYLERLNKRQSGDLAGGEADEAATAAAATMEESILAQARVVTSVDGIIGPVDLGATVSSLFYHTTVLRHSHTAAALCDVGQPQTPLLIQHLAANCPAAIPSLVRGCLEAITIGTASSRKFNLVKKSIKAMSKLANRERQRIRTTLRGTNRLLSDKVLVELELEIALDHGEPVALACFLVQHLWRAPCSAFSTNPVDTATTRDDLTDKSVGIGDTVMKDRVEASSAGTRSMPRRNPPLEHADSFHESSQQDDRCPSNHGNDGKHCLAHVIAQDAVKWIPLAMECLAKGMELEKSDIEAKTEVGLSTGRLCFILRAYLWLFVTQETKLLRLDAITKVPCLARLLELSSYLSTTLKKPEAENSFQFEDLDELYCLMLSCLLVGPVPWSKETNDKANVIDDLITAACTPRMKAFAGCVACSLLSVSEEPYLRCFLLEFLHASTDAVSTCKRKLAGEEATLRGWCRDKLNLGLIFDTAISDDTILEDSSAAIHALEKNPNILSKVAVDGILRCIFFRCSDEQYGKMIAKEETLYLLIKSTLYSDSLNEGSALIPIVGPLDLEMQARSLKRSISSTRKGLDPDAAKFLLQLVYSFAFRNAVPKSPFCFDLRCISLKEVWLFCNECKASVVASGIRDYLLRQVEAAVPEVAQLCQCIQRIQSGSIAFGRYESDDQQLLKNRLRMYIANNEIDAPGAMVEKTFLQAMLSLSEQDLTVTFISAVLTNPKSPPVFITYGKICEDPLVLMKCHLYGLWSRPGLRRVACFLLSFILDANTAMLEKTPVNDEITLDEFIAARNLLAVRCLISSAIDRVSSSGMDCPATIELIRWIISSQTGLGSIFLKQGMSCEEFDWLVDRVPELMANYSEYSSLLSEKSTLTPTERLGVADYLVKMVVFYGQRNESIAQVLIMLGLSQIISEFFLVLGPSGVSVSTIMPGSDPSMDATQISRKSALRILSHVCGIRGYRRVLKNECVVSLQKLFRMCKGEDLVGGLGVAVGSKQKAALRELQEAVSKALTAIGGTGGSM